MGALRLNFKGHPETSGKGKLAKVNYPKHNQPVFILHFFLIFNFRIVLYVVKFSSVLGQRLDKSQIHSFCVLRK